MLGEKLKNLRIKSNLSQRTLSKKCGISHAEISRIESGIRKHVSADTIITIADALDVNYSDLLNELNPHSYIHNIQFKSTSLLYDNRFTNFLYKNLLNSDWYIKTDLNSTFDILAFKPDFTWCIKTIKFKYDIPSSLISNIIFNMYGQFLFYKKFTPSKITIITDDKYIFDILTSHNPVNLNLNLSIMLINLDSYKLVEEYSF